MYNITATNGMTAYFYGEKASSKYILYGKHLCGMLLSRYQTYQCKVLPRTF